MSRHPYIAIAFIMLALVVLGALAYTAYFAVEDRELVSAAHAILATKQELERGIYQTREAFVSYEGEIGKLVSLYNAMVYMADAIKAKTPETKDFIGSLLDVAKRDLQLALGFNLDHHWTLCVYQAIAAEDSGPTQLVCVAQSRSIECDIAKARSWSEGQGVVGSSFAQNREVIVPDLHDAALGSTFDLASNAKPDDNQLYRSIASIPVRVPNDHKEVWGAVVVTSDQPSHFSTDHVRGVQTVEGARALATMLELALK
eukprot:s1_g867.t1